MDYPKDRKLPLENGESSETAKLEPLSIEVHHKDTGAELHLDPFAFPFTRMNADLVVSSAYRALHEEAAWFNLSSRGKIRLTGEDRARLLHAMSTQNIQLLQPGDGCYTFFLNAQGRILGDANVFCFEDHLLLDTEPETRQKLYEHLDRFIIADDVTLEDVTGSLATVAIEGPRSTEVLRGFGVTVPERDFLTTRWGDYIVARVDATGAGGFHIFLAPEAMTKLLELLDLAEATAEEARLVRIEHGRPRYGEEITERYLIQETGQLQAVNFSKGCYLGQEIVERVRSRAQIHRLLRPLQIETTTVPIAGTKLQVGGADAGEIASADFSPALGKVVALAYIKIPFTETGTEVKLGDATAHVG